MDELRKDPSRGQWVLIRPKAEAALEGPCPYCPGAEGLSGGEIAAYRKEGSPANAPDWTVRVVPESNAYFRIEWELAREGVGMFDTITPRAPASTARRASSARTIPLMSNGRRVTERSHSTSRQAMAGSM